MTEEALAAQPCSRCGRLVEGCELCDGPDCRIPICYRCLQLAVGQAVSQPHAHGG